MTYRGELETSSFQFQLYGASVTLSRKLQVCRGAWVSSGINAFAWTSLCLGFILPSEKEWFNSALQHGSMSWVLCSLFPTCLHLYLGKEIPSSLFVLAVGSLG